MSTELQLMFCDANTKNDEKLLLLNFVLSIYCTEALGKSQHKCNKFLCLNNLEYALNRSQYFITPPIDSCQTCTWHWIVHAGK